MPEEFPAPYSLLCSACYTACPVAEAHVVPRWHPRQRRIITAYRCNACWPTALAELRSTVRSGAPGLAASFCDFLDRRGYTDSELIRTAAPEHQVAYLEAIVNALEAGKFTLEP